MNGKEIKIDGLMDESNEFEVRDMLRKKRGEIKTFEDLVSLLEEIKNTCNTGYGTAPRAIVQAALATAFYLSSEFGITGFQAGCVMWDFVVDWQYKNNKCGLRLVDYDDMLYPQYEYKFQKTIPSTTWAAVQKEAKKNLENRDYVHPDVLAHWQSIIDGKVPFGYVIKDN